MGENVLVVLGFIDVEMDDVGFLGILVDLARNPVVKAGAGAKEEIALAARPVGGRFEGGWGPADWLGQCGLGSPSGSACGLTRSCSCFSLRCGNVLCSTTGSTGIHYK